MAQTKYYLLLLLACVIWGATPASGKLTVDSFSPLMITAMRFALVAALLFVWLAFTQGRNFFIMPRKVWYVAVAMGFMGVLVHNGLLFWGLNYTTATNTALIESIGPTATTLLAFVFLGERLNIFGWLGIVVSCVGTLCIISKGDIDVLLNLEFNIGDIMILGCEIAWSAYAIISLQAQNKVPSLNLVAWSSLFGAIWCLAVGGVTGSLHIYEVQAGALWGFAYLVIFSGIIAFVGWNVGVQHVGASKAGVFVYLVPLTGGIIGVVLLGEEILLAQIIGAVLIMGGVMVTVRSKVKLREESTQENPDEKNLLKRFPELVEAHEANVAEHQAGSAEASVKVNAEASASGSGSTK